MGCSSESSIDDEEDGDGLGGDGLGLMRGLWVGSIGWRLWWFSDEVAWQGRF